MILVLSTMNGSSNWYCISGSSRMVRLVSASFANHPGPDRAEPGARLPCVLEDKIDQLPGGAGGRVVGQVPDLAGRVGMLAEDGEAFADVGDVGVGVRLVGVAEDGGGLSGQGGGEDPVAEVGLGAAAGSEVVRGAADGHLDPAGPVGREQLVRHPPTQFSLFGVRGVGAGLRSAGGPRDGRTCRRSPCSPAGLRGFGRGEDAGL